MGKRGEQRDSLPNQYRYSRDGQALDLPGAEELLDSDSSVDVEVLKSAGCQLRDDFSGSAGHLLDTVVAHVREIQGPRAQDYHGFAAVRPFREGADCLKGLP